MAVLHARIRNLLKYKERMAHEFKKQLVFELKDLNYTSLDEDFMQRAIDCVNNHLEDCEFDQPQFADEMKTSKSTLYKKLKSFDWAEHLCLYPERPFEIGLPDYGGKRK